MPVSIYLNKKSSRSDLPSPALTPSLLSDIFVGAPSPIAPPELPPPSALPELPPSTAPPAPRSLPRHRISPPLPLHTLTPPPSMPHRNLSPLAHDPASSAPPPPDTSRPVTAFGSALGPCKSLPGNGWRPLPPAPGAQIFVGTCLQGLHRTLHL